MIKAIIKIILRVLSFVFIVSLLLSYIAAYISPEKIWFLAFFGMFYPIILSGNIILGLLWLLFKKWVVVYHFLAIILGWVYMTAHFQYSGKQFNSNDSAQTLKILSYNVRNFDLYHYDKNWNFTTNTRNKIFDFLKEQNADIICFQEFTYVEGGGFATGDTMVKFLKADNIHTEYTVRTKYKNNFGLATLSAFPVVDGGRINFPGKTNNLCIFSDISIGNDTIRIFNVHFESIHFTNEDYKFAQKLADDIDLKNHKEIEYNSKRIIARLRKAFVARAAQAEIVSKNILQSPYPTIVCGDFNDTPGSYTYHKVAKGLKDAFIESGSGFGTTYSGVFPSFRIDYILHDLNFSSYSFTTFENELSDHYPIMCHLKFDNKKKQ